MTHTHAIHHGLTTHTHTLIHMMPSYITTHTTIHTPLIHHPTITHRHQHPRRHHMRLSHTHTPIPRPTNEHNPPLHTHTHRNPRKPRPNNTARATVIAPQPITAPTTTPNQNTTGLRPRWNREPCKPAGQSAATVPFLSGTALTGAGPATDFSLSGSIWSAGCVLGGWDDHDFAYEDAALEFSEGFPGGVSYLECVGEGACGVEVHVEGVVSVLDICVFAMVGLRRGWCGLGSSCAVLSRLFGLTDLDRADGLPFVGLKLEYSRRALGESRRVHVECTGSPRASARRVHVECICAPASALTPAPRGRGVHSGVHSTDLLIGCRLGRVARSCGGFEDVAERV